MKYEEPIIKIVVIESQDIITLSDVKTDVTGENGGDFNDLFGSNSNDSGN